MSEKRNDVKQQNKSMSFIFAKYPISSGIDVSLIAISSSQVRYITFSGNGL